MDVMTEPSVVLTDEGFVVRREEVVVKPTNLVADKRFQFRSGIDIGHAEALKSALEAGITLGPMQAFNLNNQDYLVDGFHRRWAYLAVGATEVKIVRHYGRADEALAFAAKANLKHSYGLPLETTAKIAVLEVMYAPGGEWENWSYSRLAAVLRLGSHNTAKAWVERLVGEGRLPASVLERGQVVGKHGKTMDTSRIGRSEGRWAEPYQTPDGAIQESFVIVDPAQKRLEEKIKKAVLMGWIEAGQAETQRFEEMSADPNNHRLRNVVTGEIIDPHSRPADLVLAERQAVTRAEAAVNAQDQGETERQVAQQVGKLRAQSLEAPMYQIMQILSVSACKALPKNDRTFLIMDIDRCISRLMSLRAQLRPSELHEELSVSASCVSATGLARDFVAKHSRNSQPIQFGFGMALENLMMADDAVRVGKWLVERGEDALERGQAGLERAEELLGGGE